MVAGMVLRVIISVVIPVKDDSEMLARCLQTLAAQNRPADEIIVVDNDSTDDSAAVAEAFGARVVVERRPGIIAAAAAGYDAATGDVIARCDADSRLPPDWLDRIQYLLEHRPGVVAVTGRGTFYDLGPVGRAVADLLYMRLYFVAVGLAIAGPPLFGSNFAIRASAWRRVSGQVPRGNLALHDDMDLSYRLASGTVVYDRRLAVGISGRPFRPGRSMPLRIARVAMTVLVHLPRQSPPVRWWQRRRRIRSRPQ
jgi:glycosyltransferase involved in cell wall biosynthesis